MTATFFVYSGELTCVRGSKVIDRDSLSEFWEEIGCGDRYGVYVFGYRAPRGLKPLYVGQTKKQTFRKRIGQHVDSGKFNDMIKNLQRGTPTLFCIARVGSGRNSTAAVDDLEKELINKAFVRNPNLHNDRGFKKSRYIIRGFDGPGKPATNVRNLKAMVGY